MAHYERDFALDQGIENPFKHPELIRGGGGGGATDESLKIDPARLRSLFCAIERRQPVLDRHYGDRQQLRVEHCGSKRTFW